MKVTDVLELLGFAMCRIEIRSCTLKERPKTPKDVQCDIRIRKLHCSESEWNRSEASSQGRGHLARRDRCTKTICRLGSCVDCMALSLGLLRSWRELAGARWPTPQRGWCLVVFGPNPTVQSLLLPCMSRAWLPSLTGSVVPNHPPPNHDGNREF